MKESNYDNAASGYVTETFEGLSQTFTDVEILHTSEVNIVAKGKRYGRWWLLKGLRQEIAGEASYQQRLRKELEILMQLQHPNIVNAVGMELVDGLGECIVMEFIDGVTLKEWLQGTTSQQQRRRIARELTEAVGYTHTKGIVHRDLKPENILITTNGESVKLVDFGLADTDSHAILKQPAGTLRYMSPEQQNTAIADVRNDIYSLGIIFDEMKLGYGRVVKKCLLSSEKRYQNVGVLIDAIRIREKRRTRMMTAGIAIIFSLLAGMVGIQTIRLRHFAMQTAENRTELEATIVSLTDSLEHISISHHQLANEQGQLKDSQKQQKIRQQQITDAVNKGKAIINDAIKISGIEQHFDTLSNLNYIDGGILTKTFERIAEAYNIYIEQIKANYTENEISEIITQITLYDGKRRKMLVDHYNQIKAEYDRKTMQGD